MQIIATLATLALLYASSDARAFRKRGVGKGYATFYTDNACTQNPGEAVSMGNAGCLANEYDRNSIYIQPPSSFGYSPNGGPSLVWSPGNECNCQNHCASLPDPNSGNDFCWDLNGNPDATSFRWIEQTCGPNNC